MSSYRNTHWCHQCLQPVCVRTPNPVCPSCSGGFVQELNETVVNGRQDSDPFHLHGHDFSDHHRSMSPMEAFALSMQRELGVTRPSLPFQNHITQWGSRMPSSSSTTYTTDNLPFEDLMTQWRSRIPSSSSTTNNNLPFENLMTQWGSLMPSSSSSSSTTTTNNHPFENHITQWGSLMPSSSSTTTNNNNAFEWFNEAPVGSRSRPSNSNDDDLIGDDFQWMIDQMMADSARLGPHPASRSAIDSLPTIKITNGHLTNDPNCPICQDEFVLESEVRMMPCNHIYHSGCIVAWLEENNSCPVCRLELPFHVGGSGGGGGGGGSEENQEWIPPPFRWSFHS